MTCNRCRKNFEVDQTRCPHCGEPIAAAKPKQTATGFLAAIIIGLIVGFLIYKMITG